LSYEDARSEITRFAGTQFDAEVVKYFLRVRPDVWTDIRATTSRSQKRSLLDLENLPGLLQGASQIRP
jgi:hypothetical protein